MSAGPHVQERRRIKDRVAQEHGVRPRSLAWINGRLCWAHTKRPVPGIKKIVKPADTKTTSAAPTEQVEEEWWKTEEAL